MRKITVVLSCLWAAGAYSADISPYIVNGSSVTDSELANTYPTFASLYYHDGSSYGNFCGATVINSQYILTAAHCVHDTNGNPDVSKMMHIWAIPSMATESQYNTGAYQSARVSEIYYQNTYSGNLIPALGTVLPNDIAILKLESALNIGDRQSILNSSQNESDLLSSSLTSYKVVGRGLIEGQASSNGQVLQTSLTLKARSVCGASTSDGQLCFDGALQGSYKNSTCKGDSGGPVYWWDGVQYKQVGITSYGPQTCGDSSMPYTSVYTEVHDYYGWINNVVNGAVTPKYRIDKHSGYRELVQVGIGAVRTSTALVNQTVMPQVNATTVSSETSDSGGSLGLAFLTLLGLVGWRRSK